MGLQESHATSVDSEAAPWHGHCHALPTGRTGTRVTPGSPPAPFSTHRTAALRLSPAPAPGELNPPCGSRDRKSSRETCHFLSNKPQWQAGPCRGGLGSLLHNVLLTRQRAPQPPMAAPGCCHGRGDEGCKHPWIPAGIRGQQSPPPCHHGDTQRGWCSPRRRRKSHRSDAVSPLRRLSSHHHLCKTFHKHLPKPTGPTARPRAHTVLCMASLSLDNRERGGNCQANPWAMHGHGTTDPSSFGNPSNGFREKPKLTPRRSPGSHRHRTRFPVGSR